MCLALSRQRPAFHFNCGSQIRLKIYLTFCEFSTEDYEKYAVLKGRICFCIITIYLDFHICSFFSNILPFSKDLERHISEHNMDDLEENIILRLSSMATSIIKVW